MTPEDEAEAEEWADSRDWGEFWRPYENDPTKQSGYIDGDKIAKLSYLAALKAERERQAKAIEFYKDAALALNERARVAEDSNVKLGHGKTGYPELLEAQKEIENLRYKLAMQVLPETEEK